MKHDSIKKSPPRNIAVRMASDEESDNFVIQDHVQVFMRGLLAMAPYRKIDKGLRAAARRAGTVLLDRDGNRAAPVQLSDDDYYKFDYWLRDWAIERSEPRRNHASTLERRRYLITLLRMAWPREMTTLGKSSVDLGVEYTENKPPKDWEL